MMTLPYVTNQKSSVPLPTVHMAGSHESSRTTCEPPGSYEFSASRPCFKGQSQESSYELGGSDVVRGLSREPAMFQIGLFGAGFWQNRFFADLFF